MYRTDYSKPSLVEACKGQDAVISTIGVFGKSSQTNVIDAAIEAGVKRFIPSDFAYKTYDMSELERVVPLIHQRLQPNKVVLDYLKDVSARNPDFTWTAIGGGSLFDWVRLPCFKNYTLTDLQCEIDAQNRLPRNLPFQSYLYHHRLRKRILPHNHHCTTRSYHCQHSPKPN